MFQQRLNHGFADATALMTRRDADLVNPQLGRLVRMNVMYPGGKSDDLSLIDRDHQMVAVIA